MGSGQPWIDSAQAIVRKSRDANQPVWLSQAVNDILREHPDCCSKDELAEVIRQLVIEQRWALDGG
jgi:hypothetical protein